MDQVSQVVHCKTVVLADWKAGALPADAVSGSLMCSGGKLWLKGATAWEAVTSA